MDAIWCGSLPILYNNYLIRIEGSLAYSLSMHRSCGFHASPLFRDHMAERSSSMQKRQENASLYLTLNLERVSELWFVSLPSFSHPIVLTCPRLRTTYCPSPT
jgi:hypothetical protein